MKSRPDGLSAEWVYLNQWKLLLALQVTIQNIHDVALTVCSNVCTDRQKQCPPTGNSKLHSWLQDYGFRNWSSRSRENIVLQQERQLTLVSLEPRPYIVRMRDSRSEPRITACCACIGISDRNYGWSDCFEKQHCEQPNSRPGRRSQREAVGRGRAEDTWGHWRSVSTCMQVTCAHVDTSIEPCSKFVPRSWCIVIHTHSVHVFIKITKPSFDSYWLAVVML